MIRYAVLVEINIAYWGVSWSMDHVQCLPESSNTQSWIQRIESSGYGILLFNSSWFLLKCRHIYAVSSLLDTASELLEQYLEISSFKL
ncbi:hypothetical protein Tco_0123044 [Tanacetum coccineum]